MICQVFENVIVVVIVLGGFINVVLYLLGMVSIIGVWLDLDDFVEIGKWVLVLVDLCLSGYYMMFELVVIGGIQLLMKMLFDCGLLYGDCLMVIGKILVENLVDVEFYL